MNNINISSVRLCMTVGAVALLATAGMLVAATPASAATFCGHDGSDNPADGISAFTYSEQEFYDHDIQELDQDIANISQRLSISPQQACAAGWFLIDEGSKEVVLHGAKAGILGQSEDDQIFDQAFKAAVNEVQQDQQRQEGDDFLLVPVGPTEGSLPVAATLSVNDPYLGGAWGRADTSDGSWFTAANEPANGRVFYPSGDQVEVVCTDPGATYTVHFADHVEEWNYWVLTEDSTWIPAAQFDQYSTASQPNLPLCGAEN